VEAAVVEEVPVDVEEVPVLELSDDEPEVDDSADVVAPALADDLDDATAPLRESVR